MKNKIRLWITAAAAFIVVIVALIIYANVNSSNSLAPGSIKTKVFLYHAVSDSTKGDDALFVSPASLEEQLKLLANEGYVSVFADEYGTYDKKTVAITFDDGYDSVYTEAFPLLKKYNMKATVFLITSPSETRLSGSHIKEMARSGTVRFESHSVSHKNMTSFTYDEIKTELSESRSAVQKLTGRGVRCFSYPYGAYDDEIKAALREFGYKFGYAIDNGDNADEFSIKRTTVWRATTIETFKKMLETE